MTAIKSGIATDAFASTKYTCKACGHYGRPAEIHDVFDESGNPLCRLVCAYCQSSNVVIDRTGICGDGI